MGSDSQTAVAQGFRLPLGWHDNVIRDRDVVTTKRREAEDKERVGSGGRETTARIMSVEVEILFALMVIPKPASLIK